MFEILHKKDIIHIIAEIAVIAGVVYYFSIQNKKLLEHIKRLDAKLEEQDKLINKHEEILKEILASKVSNYVPFKNTVSEGQTPRIIVSTFRPDNSFVERDTHLPRIEEVEEDEKEEENDKNEPEINLDKELEEELKDLE